MIRFLGTILSLLCLFSAQAEKLVTVSGQVILKNEDLLILKGTNATYRVKFNPALGRSCTEGDVVNVRGMPQFNDWLNENRLTASNIVVKGYAPLPPTIPAEGSQIQDGHLLNEFVRLNGTISAVNSGSTGWNWVCLKTTTGDVGLTIRESSYPQDYLLSLLDAEVTVRGIVVRSWGSLQQLAPHVSLRGKDALRVTRPAPTDPFTAPAFIHIEGIHRRRITGTVLAVGDERCMLLPDTGDPVLILTRPGAVRPPVGHRATAVGFPGTDPIRLWFTESLIRDDGPSAEIPTEDPVTDLKRIFVGIAHGHLVQVRGTVRGVDTTSGPHGSRMFLETEDGRSLAVDMSAILSERNLPTRASQVRVTGICIVEYEKSSSSAAFPRFRGITILPRTPNDIVITQRPPWMTPLRVGLIVLLVVVLFVLREIFLRSAARLRIKERTTLAIELHDSLAQFLTGISLQLDAAQLAERANRTEEAGLHITRARKGLKSCRENLRYCLGDLRRASFTDAPLSEAIRQAVLPHVGAAKLILRFGIPRSRLSDTVVHAIICIVRELAVNAVRHGHASRIFVAGEYKDGQIRFSVRDDGSGFDPAVCPGSSDGHFGLLGIRERLRDLRGSLLLDSAPGKGTKATVTLTP